MCVLHIDIHKHDPTRTRNLKTPKHLKRHPTPAPKHARTNPSLLQKHIHAPLPAPHPPNPINLSPFKPIQSIPMITIAAKRALADLAPILLLAQPVAAQELADAGVGGLLLRRLERDELVEVFVDGCGLAVAAGGLVGRAVAGFVSGCRRWGGGGCGCEGWDGRGRMAHRLMSCW